MSAGIEPVPAERRLRIAVLGDFEGAHTRSWLRWFIDRGHDLHAISYYPPRAPLDGVTLHALRPRRMDESTGGRPAPVVSAPAAFPLRGLLRIAHALRYRRAGLARVLREIAPDVFHAHFVVEHGFYGALAGFHPYVVTAWGSDILVEGRGGLSRRIARWTAARADLLTSNNAYMADEIAALGVPRDKVEVVTLGADRYFLEGRQDSANVRGGDPTRASAIISTRAHEPLYNVGEILQAYAVLARRRPGARLVVAHEGSLTENLRRRAATAGGDIEFAGHLERAAFRDALTEAEIFVSVPSSDATSVALLQAMAAGCFPIVSDLPSQREWVDDGVNGFRVPLHRPDALAERIAQALDDPDLRLRAAAINARIVEERGLNETQMAKMESLYLRLAGRA